MQHTASSERKLTTDSCARVLIILLGFEVSANILTSLNLIFFYSYPASCPQAGSFFMQSIARTRYKM